MELTAFWVQTAAVMLGIIEPTGMDVGRAFQPFF
jgi:hypothetical protein